MVDTSKPLVTKLKTILPTYYELVEHPYTMPCITYMAYDNQETDSGNTLAYSSVAYYIKLWGKDIATLMPYSIQIDTAMKSLGYNRESYNEMAIGNELCFIFQYRGLSKEERS